MMERGLAAAAKVSTNTITRFERGEELLPRTINAICKALDTKLGLFPDHPGRGDWSLPSATHRV
jgi:transcriptional regulator with XRE-family HTH domain